MHRIDLDGDRRVTEAEYVLFKLMQMQKVDLDILARLIEKYHELDADGTGFLQLGSEIPSAGQVERLKGRAAEIKAATGRDPPLASLWNAHRERTKNLGNSGGGAPYATIGDYDENGDDNEEEEDGDNDNVGGAFRAAYKSRQHSSSALSMAGYYGYAPDYDDDYDEGSDGSDGGEHTMAEEAAALERKQQRARSRKGSGKGAGAKAKKGKSGTAWGYSSGGGSSSSNSKFNTNTNANASKVTRLDSCHDFKWSRRLWAKAEVRVGRVALSSFLAYCGLSYWLLTREDGLDALDSCYFISATLSSVGYGDFAPVTQRTRLAA